MVFRRVDAVRLRTHDPYLRVGEEWGGYACQFPKPGEPFLFTTARGRLTTSEVIRVLRCDDTFYVQTLHSVYRISITEVDY